jgi:hypothetical protein
MAPRLTIYELPKDRKLEFVPRLKGFAAVTTVKTTGIANR